VRTPKFGDDDDTFGVTIPRHSFNPSASAYVCCINPLD
jgi:hypothetical protein